MITPWKASGKNEAGKLAAFGALPYPFAAFSAIGLPPRRDAKCGLFAAKIGLFSSIWVKTEDWTKG
jgi:hypothetical protein